MTTNNSWNSNTPMDVNKGGLGGSTHALNEVLVGAGTSPVNSITAGAAGTVLTSNGPSVDPSFQTFDDFGYIWSTISSNTNMESGHGYISNAVSNINLLLPPTSAVGDSIIVTRLTNPSFTITQGAGQRIFMADSGFQTTLGVSGFLRAQQNITTSYPIVILHCIVADTFWAAVIKGSFFVI